MPACRTSRPGKRQGSPAGPAEPGASSEQLAVDRGDVVDRVLLRGPGGRDSSTAGSELSGRGRIVQEATYRRGQRAWITCRDEQRAVADQLADAADVCRHQRPPGTQC